MESLSKNFITTGTAYFLAMGLLCGSAVQANVVDPVTGIITYKTRPFNSRQAALQAASNWPVDQSRLWMVDEPSRVQSLFGIFGGPSWTGLDHIGNGITQSIHTGQTYPSAAHNWCVDGSLSPDEPDNGDFIRTTVNGAQGYPGEFVVAYGLNPRVAGNRRCINTASTWDMPADLSNWIWGDPNATVGLFLPLFGLFDYNPYFGQGCGNTTGPQPTLDSLNPAKAGNSNYNLRLRNAQPGATYAIYLGLRSATPIPLPPFGRGCELKANPAASFYIGSITANNQGQGAFQISIPLGVTGIVGFEAVSIDAQGVITTNFYEVWVQQ